MLWRSSERSIRSSVANALLLVQRHGFRSVEIPLTGAGTGGGSEKVVQAMIEAEIAGENYAGFVVLVRHVSIAS